jgi:hypothetical protein
MWLQEEDPALAVLRTAIDRIIPPDDFPGAWDAGAGDYIRRQLAGDLRHLAPLLETGLAALDAEARASKNGSSFAALAPNQQDRLLANVERGSTIAAWPVPPRQFFTLLVRLTMEGYYADPGNGGNRQGIAWRMIGYDPRLPEEQYP